ncbi:hypothetical protein PLESTM_001586200 [Pleodorina starrii]|nr:hypothetical protein PLESTM_001586200 [Pleodorina starrii]
MNFTCPKVHCCDQGNPVYVDTTESCAAKGMQCVDIGPGQTTCAPLGTEYTAPASAAPPPPLGNGSSPGGWAADLLKDKRKLGAIAGALVLLVLLVLGCIVWNRWRKRRQQRYTAESEYETDDGGKPQKKGFPLYDKDDMDLKSKPGKPSSTFKNFTSKICNKTKPLRGLKLITNGDDSAALLQLEYRLQLPAALPLLNPFQRFLGGLGQQTRRGVGPSPPHEQDYGEISMFQNPIAESEEEGRTRVSGR